MRKTVLLAVLGFSFSAFGATPFKRALTEKKNAYLQNGVFIGGRAGEGASLLNVRRTYSSKAKIERVIMDIGDREAKPLGKSMSYFQVAMDGTNRRIVVDLAQLRYAKISEAQLRNLFAKSPFVEKVSLTFDPEDKSGTMVLDLKRPARLEVFQLLKAKKPGRVVMDLTPLTMASKTKPTAARKVR